MTHAQRTSPPGKDPGRQAYLHVDTWLDEMPRPYDNEGQNYARMVLDYRRMPAWKQAAYRPWMGRFELYCSYHGKRYRCNGASRMGDVWLHDDFKVEVGYVIRANVAECYDWGSTPEEVMYRGTFVPGE